MRLIDADALIERLKKDNPQTSKLKWAQILADNAPTIETKWIPCSERLPEERNWYLGIFEEPDTGWINPLPFICDYLLGTKTKVTTKEGWILRGFTDREEYIDYYFNLECVAWMPLPKPYREDGEA